MSANFDLLEDEILTRLQPLVTANASILLEKTPEDEADYNRVWKRPLISVFAESANFEETVDTAIQTQSSDARVIVSVHTKKLRGESGCRNLVSAVEAKLLGYRPSNYKKLSLVSEQYQFNTNIWECFIVFSAKGHIVEVDDTTPPPNLVNIQYETAENADWFDVPNTNNPDTL